VSHFHEHGVWDLSFVRKAQLAKLVSDELRAPKVYSFAVGEANTGQVLAVGDNGKFQRGNHRKVQRKARYKSPYLPRQLSVFSALTKNRVYKIVEVVLRHFHRSCYRSSPL
jgi:hypothetical protein